jgi:hypothetical protein
MLLSTLDGKISKENAFRSDSELGKLATPQEKKNLRRYREIRATNLHKMLPIPVCKLS